MASVVVHALNELSAPVARQARPEATALLDEALREKGTADEGMAWVYPHLLDSERPVKLTASGLLREAEGPRELPQLAERPKFMQEAGLTGAERGSAYHRALQMLDLAPLRGLSAEALTAAIRAQLDALRRQNRVTKVERAAVQPRRLARFFAGETGERLLRSATVRREWPFNVRMRVEEAWATVPTRATAGMCSCRARWTVALSRTGPGCCSTTRQTRRATARPSCATIKNNSPSTRWRLSASPACRCGKSAFACWLRARKYPCEVDLL